MGLRMTQSIELRQEVRLRARIYMRIDCKICGKEDLEEARTPEQQLEAARTQQNRYNPCIGCGAHIPSWGERTHRGLTDETIQWLEKQEIRMKRKAQVKEKDRGWPPDTKSLVGQAWSGDCPLGHGEMYLSVHDYYECKVCNLQVQMVGGPVVTALKGDGQLKMRHGHYISAVDELPGVGGWRILEDHRVTHKK